MCIHSDDYSNTVVLNIPKSFGFSRRTANVDECIAAEILYLWGCGVKTIECCCGHGEENGYIAVTQDSIKKMIELNYKSIINPIYPNAKEFFKPKTNVTV